jgi:DNA-binding MurR/RpiR family transcriptional regulator
VDHLVGREVRGGEFLSDTSSLTARLEEVFPSLSPQLRLAARYVLDAPDDIGLNSMRTVAAHAGVHPSTFVRLARELDFSGYAQFREPFRQRLRTHGDRYSDRARNLQARKIKGDASETGSLLQEVLQTGDLNLQNTLSATSAEELSDLAVLLDSARRIYIVGMRKCYPVAYYLHYAFRMFQDNVVLVNGVAATVADDLRNLQKDDVLIAIGFDAYTRGTVRATRYAASVGASVVAITDSPVSPLAEGARQTFVVANDSPSFFRSLASAMALAEAIVAYLVAEGGDAAVEHLTRTERHLEEFGTYWESDDTAVAAGGAF